MLGSNHPLKGVLASKRKSKHGSPTERHFSLKGRLCDSPTKGYFGGEERSAKINRQAS